MNKNTRRKPHRLDLDQYCGQIDVAFTACTKNRNDSFVKQNLVDLCVSALEWARLRNDCIVLIYCFMPDHCHIVFRGKTEKSDTHNAMSEFKKKSGFEMRSHSYYWQKSFYDRIIFEEQLPNQLLYIAENPVRKGIVEHWKDYPFTGSLGISEEELLEIMI